VEASTPQDIEALFPKAKRPALEGFDQYWAAKFEAHKKAAKGKDHAKTQ
jgi:hypothetical protein